MAENTPPALLHNAQRSTNKHMPLAHLEPMASDRLYNIQNLDDLGRMQLISPPPEETLNFIRTSVSFYNFSINLCNSLSS
jgi:hypothetical protein